MYNIDFKVSGKIASVTVDLNDTIPTLIFRMKHLDAFKKYSRTELEEKLVKNLQQITASSTIDQKIKIRIRELTENFKSSQPVDRLTQIKHNINNNTFVNILQESTINSSYLGSRPASQQKLRRKYNSEKPQQNCEELMQNKLKYNYNKAGEQSKTGEQRDLNKIQNDRTKAVNSYQVKNKRPFKYLNDEQPRFEKSIVRKYSDKISECRQLQPRKQSSSYIIGIQKSHLEYEKLDEKAYEDRSMASFPFRDNNRDKIITNAKKQHYNPVPKLDQLIEKSRSMSKIGQRNYGHELKQRNINIGPSLPEKRETAGKIHHRQDLTTESSYKNKLRVRQNFVEQSYLDQLQQFKLGGIPSGSSGLEENRRKQNSLYLRQNRGKYPQNQSVYFWE